jgi:hypothetical protein
MKVEISFYIFCKKVLWEWKKVKICNRKMNEK